MVTVTIFLMLTLAGTLAHAEPVVNVYSSMAEKDVRQLGAEFERRHGIKVNLWRSGKNRVLERVLREARGGRYEVDVIC
jgi:iron(III) transport system substrate-binding protein